MYGFHLANTGALLPNKNIQVLSPVKLNNCPHNGTTTGATTGTKASTGTLCNDSETKIIKF
jgi:hypothetical protein